MTDLLETLLRMWTMSVQFYGTMDSTQYAICLANTIEAMILSVP